MFCAKQIDERLPIPAGLQHEHYCQRRVRFEEQKARESAVLDISAALDAAAQELGPLPVPSPAPEPGLKRDGGKPRWSLLPFRAVRLVVDVLEFGAQKYSPGNWRHVQNARERYFNAATRHLIAWWGGEKNDPESELPHLACVACCVLFLLELEDVE